MRHMSKKQTSIAILGGFITLVCSGCLIKNRVVTCQDVEPCPGGSACNIQSQTCQPTDAALSENLDGVASVTDLAAQPDLIISPPPDMLPSSPTWHVVFKTPNKEALFGIHGISSSAIWAVGDKGTLVKHVNAWNTQSSSMTGAFRAVFANSSTDAWACGEAGQCYRTTDGINWTSSFSGFAVEIRSMSGLPLAGELWAVTNQFISMGGQCEGIVYNGMIWRGADTGLTISANGVWAKQFGGNQTRWVVGDNKTASRFDYGTLNWTNYTVATAGTFNLQAVWGSALNDIWAVGTGGIIARFDGSAWNLIASSITSDLNAIWGKSSSDIWFVGVDGVALHWDGNNIKTNSTMPRENLNGIWGDNNGKFWAVSASGTIFEYY